MYQNYFLFHRNESMNNSHWSTHTYMLQKLKVACFGTGIWLCENSMCLHFILYSCMFWCTVVVR